MCIVGLSGVGACWVLWVICGNLAFWVCCRVGIIQKLRIFGGGHLGFLDVLYEGSIVF